MITAEAKTNEDSALGFSISKMDKSIDPRKDFYRYSVGEWLDTNPIPKDKARWSAFNELQERNLNLLKGILEDSARNASASSGSPIRLVGDFYKSAMDTSRIEELKFQPIESLLKLVDNVKPGKELAQCLAKLRNSGVQALFSSYSAADKKNSSFYAFYIDQGGLSLPDREYYLADSFAKIRESYRSHVATMFKLAGESEQESKRLSDIVLRIETELAKTSRSRTDLRDEEKNYNRISTKDLEERFSILDLNAFLKDSSIPQADFVVIGQPEFFDFAQELVSKESIEVIRFFLRWRVLHTFAPQLHSLVEQEDFDFFHKKLLGQQEPEARWKRATMIIDELLGEALGSAYVEKYFPPYAKEKAAFLIDDLREVFKDRLTSLPWMTENTRKQALAKFERFRVKIGYPEQFRDYSSVRIDPKDYVGNIVRASEFEALRQARRVGKIVDWKEWRMTPPTVNAYFHPMENTINFPAGILQPPFFDPALDDAVNYGAIGVVIGHKITHGYDDQGRRFDADGNLHDWWLKEDEEGFLARAKAVVDLYNSIEPLPGTRINGELTLGENIADFGGVSLAYEALGRRLAKEPTKRKNIDGLMPEQRFFISYAQIWRENIREEEARRSLIIDPHSPMRYRAMLPSINHPAFDLAFPPTGNESRSLNEKQQRVAVW